VRGPRQGVGGPNAQGQTVQQQLDWYKLIYALAEENINSGGPLKVRPQQIRNSVKGLSV